MNGGHGKPGLDSDIHSENSYGMLWILMIGTKILTIVVTIVMDWIMFPCFSHLRLEPRRLIPDGLKRNVFVKFFPSTGTIQTWNVLVG